MLKPAWSRGLAAFTAATAAACAESSTGLKRTVDEPERCAAQIIVGLKPTVLPGISDREIAAALSAAGVELEPVRRVAIDTRVFLLRSDEPDRTCRAALQRLRSDARVAWVELNERRKSHGHERNSSEG